MMRLRIFIIGCIVLLGCCGVSAESNIRSESTAIRAAVDKVSPRVVQLRYFGGDEAGVLSVTGEPITAFLIDSDGWIVASSYGLESPPATILVRFDDGTQSTADLVARDRPRRIVLLKTKALDGNFASLATATPRVGQRAIAVGRVLRADQINLSVGVISALGRFSGRAIQTDAAVSPSNYGGPLLSLDGSLLGILTPIAPKGQQGTDWYDSGIGFAVPIAEIDERLDRLKSGKDIHSGWLGVGLVEGAPMWVEPSIASVAEESPADMAGLQPGDRVLSLNNYPTPSLHVFRREMAGYDAGETCQLLIERADDQLNLIAVLASKPE